MTTLISIRSLKKYFPIYEGFLSRNTKTVKAVDGVSLDIGHGEILGLVGESGCGLLAGSTFLNLPLERKAG